MTQCDKCGSTENWPGPVYASTIPRAESADCAILKCFVSLSQDLCKPCQAELRDKLDEIAKEFNAS